MNLQTASPAEIDTILAEIDGRAAKAHSDWTVVAKKAREVEKAIKIATATKRHTFWTEQNLAEYESRAASLKTAYEATRAEMDPYNAEFQRRGGWTRAFIVAGGHVHSSMRCSTCNNGRYMTRFGWLTELSAHSEAEIVDLAGERACTACYPSAPVTDRPSRLFHADEVAAQAARDERAAAKAAKEAKTAAAALGASFDGPYEKIDTIRKAKSWLTDYYAWTDHPHYQPVAEKIAPVAEALAARLGTSAEEELLAAKRRAAKRK